MRTLVWLHAFPLNADMWAPQLDAVPRGWRALALDFAGAGETDPLGRVSAPTLDDLAADAIDLLQALHVSDAVIGGLSMGGYVAFALFRLMPPLFTGLILADTRATADTPEGLEGRRRMIALAERDGASAVAADMLPKLLAETTRGERPDVVSRVKALIESVPVATIVLHTTAMMARRDSTPLLGEIRCPTLVVVGREDSLTPPADSEKLQRGIGGAVLEVIDAAGHLSNLEQPAAFNAAVTAFLTHRV